MHQAKAHVYLVFKITFSAKLVAIIACKCVFVYVRARVCVCMRACVHACVCTCMYVCVPLSY